MLIIFALSSIPGEDQTGDSEFVWVIEAAPKLLQKSMHVLFYGTLMCLWVWSLQKWGTRARRLLAAAAVTVLYGASMEWLQLGIAGRFGTLSDVLLNALGALCGLLACMAASRRVSGN